MKTRIGLREVRAAIGQLRGLWEGVADSGLEQSLLDLMLVRASQLNRCAFCLDMHMKDARVSGETEQRLYSLTVWREAPFYSERERAALAWTEAVTLLGENGVPDELYDAVRRHFSEQEIIALTMALIYINGFNRLGVSLRYKIPGDYTSRRKAGPVPTVHAQVVKRQESDGKDSRI